MGFIPKWKTPPNWKWASIEDEQELVQCDNNWETCHPKCTYCGRRTRFTENGPNLVQAGCFGEEILNGTYGNDEDTHGYDLEMMNDCTYLPNKQSYEEWCICDDKDGCNMKKA